MDNEEFMESMKSTWKKAGGPYAHFQKDDLAHAVIGLSAEAGELLDEFKKWRFYQDGRAFPQERFSSIFKITFPQINGKRIRRVKFFGEKNG